MKILRQVFSIALWSIALCGSRYGVALADEVRTYYVTDGLGSPVVATDANGNSSWSEDYLPYGSRRFNSTNAQGNQRWFTSGVQNRDTRLVYLGHRFMDPTQGRFVSMDPSGVDVSSGGNFNRYWYANNNPYAYVDPDGGNILSVPDWYDFARDNGKLWVNEGIFAAATIFGNEGVANIAVEEIEAARGNAILATVGVINPVPGTGKLAKAGRAIHEAETVGEKVRAAERAEEGVVGLAQAARGAAATRSSLQIGQQMHRAYKVDLVNNTTRFERIPFRDRSTSAGVRALASQVYQIQLMQPRSGRLNLTLRHAVAPADARQQQIGPETCAQPSILGTAAIMLWYKAHKSVRRAV